MNKIRNKSRQRNTKCGNLLIITEGKSEQNYIKGLCEYLNKSYPKFLTPTNNTYELLNNIINEMYNGIYSDTYIIFDKDNIPNNSKFNNFIRQIESNKINAVWSNPCLEIWYFAYFGKMPNYTTEQCNREFKALFKKMFGTEYDKNDPDIYKKLIDCPETNEDNAIKLAIQKLKEAERNYKDRPSEQCPATKMFLLVKNIKD